MAAGGDATTPVKRFNKFFFAYFHMLPAGALPAKRAAAEIQEEGVNSFLANWACCAKARKQDGAALKTAILPGGNAVEYP